MWQRSFMFLLGAVTLVLLNSSGSHADEAYVGSNAEGKSTLYRISYRGPTDIALEALVELPRTPGAEFSGVALHPNGLSLFCCVGGHIIVYDLVAGKYQDSELAGQEIDFFDGPVVFSSSGKYLYVLSTTLKSGEKGFVLEVPSLRIVTSVDGSAGNLRAAAFSPDETTLWIGKENGIAALSLFANDTATTATASAPEMHVGEVPNAISWANDTFLVYLNERNAKYQEVLYRVRSRKNGQYSDVLLRGYPLQQCHGFKSFFSYDPQSETVNEQGLDGKLVKSFSLSLADLLPDGELQPGRKNEHTIEYLIGGTRAVMYPQFTDGYVSPDCRHAIMVYSSGIAVASYVSVVDLSSGVASSAMRVGAIDGGISNLIFRPQ